MLTRDLLQARVRQGKLRPQFINVDDPALLETAKTLVEHAKAGVGGSVQTLEETLGQLASASSKPRVGQGLVKLLLDRTECEEADPACSEFRLQTLRKAAQLLGSLPLPTGANEYEAALGKTFDLPLPDIRERLYADLPGRRRVLSFDTLPERSLLARYNMAQAQGPLLSASKVRLRAVMPELLRVRRVLRWLKFCRLVAEVTRVGDDWLLDVQGPAALFTQQKRYGLQLARFLTVVPSLTRWELTAEVKQGRKGEPRNATLVLSHEDPLESPHASALGHVPEEVKALSTALAEKGLEVDYTPVPRHTGARGMCVPDFSIRALGGQGREIAVELFHPWHASALVRRLEELSSRPDPGLWLGVDRAVVKDALLGQRLADRPDVFLFNGFPSARVLKERLESWFSAPAVLAVREPPKDLPEV